MFEQPEVQFTEFDNYLRRPGFIGHTVLDGATKGECEHNVPLGPADMYICVNVHVVYVCLHMYTYADAFLSIAVWAHSFSLDAVTYYAPCGPS